MKPDAINLEELIQFNDQLVALVRAGIPLSPTLADRANRELPKALRNVEQQLRQRIDAGESLDRIVEDSSDVFPPVYRAVVLAGLRIGNLAQALEALAESLRRLASLRTLILQSLLYPMIVVFLAGVLFALCVQPVFGPLIDAIRLQQVQVPAWMISTLESLSRYGKYLAMVPILLLLPMFVYAWRASRSAANAHRLTQFLSRFPGAGRILKYGTLAMYFEMLQLLVSQSAPLDEALPLAAQASGAPDLVDASLDLTNRIHRGESVVEVTRSIGSLPPLIACLLAASPSSDKLAKSLSRLAEAYHRQATNAASRFRVSFPILATFFIGGATTAVYALIFFVPWFTFLTNLAMPPA